MKVFKVLNYETGGGTARCAYCGQLYDSYYGCCATKRY